MKLIDYKAQLNRNRLYVLYSKGSTYSHIYLIDPEGTIKFVISSDKAWGYDMVVTKKILDYKAMPKAFASMEIPNSLLYELTEDETNSMIAELI